MTDHTYTRSVRWALLAPAFMSGAFLAALGCGSTAAPPIEGRLAIENVARWYQSYRIAHSGKAPPDEDSLFTFVQNRLRERGETIERDELLNSPRDGHRYIVNYGAKAPSDLSLNVAVYEKEGYAGKMLLAFESARSREVDAAELQALLADPK